MNRKLFLKLILTLLFNSLYYLFNHINNFHKANKKFDIFKNLFTGNYKDEEKLTSLLPNYKYIKAEV